MEGHGHDHHHHHSPPPEEPKKPGYPHHPEEHQPHERPPSERSHAHHGHDAHDKHAGHSVEMFRDKFWVTLLLTIPTLIWGHMLPGALGYAPPHIPLSHWIPPVFGTAVFLYGGLVFVRGALQELSVRKPGMMTLIALAITVAFLFSVAVTLGYRGMPLWEELATLVTIMVLGHWLEMRSISQAQGALKELAKLLPGRATRVQGESLEEVDLAELREGDVVLVRPGESIPADGKVSSGKSDVNESMITGESRPIDKKPDDEVIAGTVNGSGSLRISVTGTGEKTALAGIMRLVEQAQTSRSGAQALADRAAFVLTIVALGAGAATFVVWLAVGAEPSFAIERTVTTLVISCPHALGLAIPLVVAISTTIGARSGLLVRDRRGLEEARRLNSVVFDKTGTLTLGELRVVEVTTADGLSADAALSVAASLERESEHPIARAVVKSAEEKQLQLAQVSAFNSIAGRGVRAIVNDRGFALGGPNMLKELGVALSPKIEGAARQAAERGQSTVYLIEGNEAVASFAVADQVRPESHEAIVALHKRGIEVVMLTGDARAVARAVAKELNIDTVYAEVLPQDKANTIRELQAEGKRVGMVGDGVNDAPALLTADVGVAIGAGTHVAVEAGDVVLVRSDPRDVPRIIALSRATYRKMVQNLWWAAGYNVIAIPLAAGVLASKGIVLSPAIGAVLMSVSTIVVAINAQLLRRVQL